LHHFAAVFFALLLALTSIDFHLLITQWLNAMVYNTTHYLNTSQVRTYNDDDSVLSELLEAGDYPFVDYLFVGDSIEDGV
jgi:hypothetical protein